MHFRIPRRGALLALLALLPAAACKDQTPTLTGDPFFPGGSRAVTLESILPASQFLTTIGSFSGFEKPLSPWPTASRACSVCSQSYRAPSR